MEREELKNALIALRSALDNVIRVMDGKGAETPSEGKRDTTVSEFWQSLRDNDQQRARGLYNKFKSLNLTDKQKSLLKKMRLAYTERFEKKEIVDDLPY